MYGVAGAQAYVFMFNSERDTLWLKSLVVIVLYVFLLYGIINGAGKTVSIIETVHSAFILRLLYYYTLNVLNSFPAVSAIDW